MPTTSFQQPKLAIHGGEPAVPSGPPDWPQNSPLVRDALEQCYASGQWGKYDGPSVRSFARQIAELHAVRFVQLCSSGTFAVELALRSLGVGQGDEVILAGYDFSGNFRSVEATGAFPVLVDIDRSKYCLDVNSLSEAVSEKSKAIIVSHLHGGLAPMSRIRDFAELHGLSVVEDACQAPLAEIDGKLAGSWGDVGVWSFGGSKLLTAGRGGAMFTDREDVFQRAKIFCERGNHAFPLSELQAAVLMPQLHQLDALNQIRLRSIQALTEQSGEFPELTPVDWEHQNNRSSFYKFAWHFDDPTHQIPRAVWIQAIQAEGVAIDVGFRGFTLRSKRRCRQIGSLVNCGSAGKGTVLLHHPVLLSPSETITQVANCLVKVSASLAEL